MTQQERANKALQLRLEIENYEMILNTKGFSEDRQKVVRELLAKVKTELAALIEGAE